MSTHAGKTEENKSQSVAQELAEKQAGAKPVSSFIDNRPETVVQRKQQEMINNSPRQKQLKAFHEMANSQAPVQRKEKEEAEKQLEAGEAGLQQENNTGLPGDLKSGIESLSGFSMDDVKVHYNSGKPAQLKAHAYAQGNEIHLGAGQERHLPHEAWHVVQQKQGRVNPTIQLKGGHDINEDAGLEREADLMGEKALSGSLFSSRASARLRNNDPREDVIQGRWNHKYKAYKKTSKRDGVDLSEESSLDIADASLEDAEGLAYIVNSILPYTDIKQIPGVVAAILDGLSEDDQDCVAIILGINAPEENSKELDAAIVQATALIMDLPVAVALVRSTFKGDFPFGQMRNEVLHSTETRRMTEYFLSQDLHPYISIQDFDDGSRRVGSDKGEHIFKAIDNKLFKSDEEVQEEGEGVLESLPLMIGGGYRVGDRAKLVESTKKRLEKMKPKKEDGKKEATKKEEPLDVSGELEGFGEGIEKDMELRDKYADISPLLPYAPEPNLFIDAGAVYAGSPLTNTRLEFGKDGAEYTELAKRLAKFSAEELESYYTDEYNAEKEDAAQARDLGDDASDDTEILADIRTQLLIDAQNNRHPVRGEAIHVDFKNLAVETDLSRLAAAKVSKGKDPQSHSGLATVTDRIYDTKSDKKGAKLGDVRDKLGKDLKKEGLMKMMEDSMVDDDSGSKKSKDPVVKGVGKKLSPALSTPFSEKGLFSGLHYGMSPDMKKHLLYQVATQQQRMAYLDNELQLAQANRESLQANAFPLLDSQVQLRVSQWTLADGHCGVYSLGVLLREDLSRFGLIEKLQTKKGTYLPEQREQIAAVQEAIDSISGANFNRWLSDTELVQIGGVLGLNNIAVVQFDSTNQRWITMQGDPANAAYIIGGVSTRLGGSLNHWVVVRRQ